MLFADAIKKKQRGQGLLEYALLMILIAILIIALLAIFGSKVGNMFSFTISRI